MDAQAVWTAYVKHMTTSTKADMEVERLVTFLTSKRLNESYRGTTNEFILEWLRNLSEYEKITDVTAHFPSVMKKAMLQNALNGLFVFRNVKTSEELDIAKGRGSLNFDEYTTVVQRVAEAYDKRLSVSVPRRRQVNQHSFEYGDIDPEYDDTFHQVSDDDFDNPDDSYTINATRQRQPNNFRHPLLPRAVWEKLSTDDRSAWNTLSSQGKGHIIFGLRSPTTSTGTTTSATATRKVQFTDTTANDSDSINDTSTSTDIVDPDPTPGTFDSLLINAAASKNTKSVADLRRLLSVPEKPNPKSSTPRKSNIKINTLDINKLTYVVSRSSTQHNGALVDRGANGGIAGDDVRIIERTDRSVDVSGVGNHQITDLTIVTAGGVVPSQHGPVIVIMHQYAHAPMSRTIHSSVQLEHFANRVDDRSLKVCGSTQSITTHEGFVFPLEFKHGLPYMPIRPFTDAEWNELPHVILTSDNNWDPSIMDVPRDSTKWLTTQADTVPLHPSYATDADDDPTSRPLSIYWASQATSMLQDVENTYEINVNAVTPTQRNYGELTKYFLHVSPMIVRKTFENTTQFARTGIISGHIYNTYRAPFPALNVQRRNEPVATDTVYSDTPAVDGGATCAQFFAGISTKFVAVYGMTTDSQFWKGDTATLLEESKLGE
jgi:hypothetical protein